jgi:uncharacterized protein YlzI (FlbEa/FlbD family)
LVTLVDGSRYVVRESVAEIVDKVRAFRASVVLLHLVPSPDPEA